MDTHRRPFVFDMETADPDDFLALALLCGHPRVDLKAVTVTPGTPHQVGVVRYCLSQFGLDIPVGAFNLHHGGGAKTCVSEWHYRSFGAIPPSREALPGWEVLLGALDRATTVVTGGPLKNLGALLRKLRDPVVSEEPPDLPSLPWGPLFVQGGFAGEGVVPTATQLAKFRGRVTCPSWNLDGDPKAATAVIASPVFSSKHFVSKNVCHRVIYDRPLHLRLLERFGAGSDRPPHIRLITDGMAFYLQRKPGGKRLHDPLAACCAIDPHIGTWAEVELHRAERGGGWGARLAPGSGTWIITDYDRRKFIETLTEV